MSKTVKKALIGAGIAIGVVALVFGGLTIYRNVSRKPVDVYPVRYLAQENWDSYNTTTYGTVSSEGIQKVLLGERQTVTEVLVSPGDEVHVGDALLALDTTLSGLDVKKAEIALGKQELALEQAQAELSTLRSLRPHSSRLVVPENTVEYTPHETPFTIMGQGLAGDPFIILWGESDVLDFGYISQLVALYRENAEANAAKPAPDPDTEDDGTVDVRADDDGSVYVILITRQNDALNAPIIERRGVRIFVSGTAATGFSFYAPVVPASVEQYTEIPQPYYEESGSWYTAAELTQLRAAKETEIKKLEIEVGLARVNLEKLRQETTDGFVRATVDGVVTAVNDPEQALRTGAPVVSVSAGGGYYVTGTMSEYDLLDVRVGQTVSLTVYDWSKGGEQFYQGEIVKISEYPSEARSYYGDGNPTASAYPFTVFVDGSADISDTAYVEIQYGSTQQDSSFYLPNAFFRTEGGKSFVYVLGEDGRLEQRTVTLGRDLWGSYTQIRGGLSLDDCIAFPYGTDVVSGAKTTVQDDLEKLYQAMYY